MNPLSSHPPRTPRTSIVPNSSSTYSNGKYQNSNSNEDNREKVEIDDIDIDEEEESVKSAERKIRKEEVWREMFLTSAGRDKAFVSTIMLGSKFYVDYLLQTRNLSNIPFGLGWYSTYH